MKKIYKLIIFCIAPLLIILTVFIFIQKSKINTDNGKFDSVGEDGRQSARIRPPLTKTNPIDSREKVDSVLKSVKKLNFSNDSQALQRQLSKEIFACLNLPEPDRSEILGTITRNFILHFSSDPNDVDGLIAGLKVFRSVLAEFQPDIRMDLVNQQITDWIADYSTSNPGIALSREKSLKNEYSKENSDIFRVVAAAVIAQRLANDVKNGFSHLKEISDRDLRIETERSLIIKKLEKNSNDSINILSYYLSNDSELGVENRTLIKIISSSYDHLPEEVSDTVANAPLGSKRDSALFQMVIRMAKTDPEAAVEWINMISDPAIKADALKRYSNNPPLSQMHLPPPSGAPDPFAN